jgi:hypothetical protein
MNWVRNGQRVRARARRATSFTNQVELRSWLTVLRNRQGAGESRDIRTILSRNDRAGRGVMVAANARSGDAGVAEGERSVLTKKLAVGGHGAQERAFAHPASARIRSKSA